MSEPEMSDPIDESAIAIIGMSCRFPGAADVQHFWQNLKDGKESITFFSDEELLAARLDPEVLKHPHYVKANGFLANLDVFDAAFFEITPREAELMDPQQRLFLECAWEAFEHAGYDVSSYRGLIGVYGGVGLNTYLLHILSVYPDLLASEEGYMSMIGNDKDFVPTRVSYKLNLKGPSVTVQTACSTSLVAVHLACQSLLNGECDMALAGGVAINILQKSGYLYQEGMILSPDGHCRTFDAQARGTVRGNGAGVVVLKPLASAVADGDYIYAIIKGSAINNDGAAKVGFTAPSIDGQAAVIGEAMAMARITPVAISYIEAHGTGTPLGDPIEIAALTAAFRAPALPRGFCGIGSVKTNLGHLDAAAGVASLIKTVLALEHKCLPPSLHFTTPNPEIDFANSPFYVVDKLTEWQTQGMVRHAGVSAFGIGGTNAHAVLAEAPLTPPSGASRPWHVLVLSAKSDTALAAMCNNLASALQASPAPPLADVAYTLAVGRKAWRYRRALVCQDVPEAARLLPGAAQEPASARVAEPQAPALVFLFPGQGAQYPGMGRELYQHEAVFREQVDLCADILKAHLGYDLRSVLYPGADAADAAEGPWRQTAMVQPVLFVLEYALAALWASWGIRPRAMLGHSLGEYVAACVAEVFTLEDALAIVAMRATMMQQCPPGAMLAVALSESEVARRLGRHLAIAAVNGPALNVVSGPTEALHALQQTLTHEGVTCRTLVTSHAFHSAMMDSVVAPFREQLARFTLHAPCLPFLSNVTGTWITAEAATDPSYWATQLRRTVRFADGLQHVFEDPRHVLLEVGPGQTLATLSRRHPQKPATQQVWSSLPHTTGQRSEHEALLTTLGQLWTLGVDVDWPAYYNRERRLRVPLPAYPFERQRFWIEPRASAAARRLPAHDPALPTLAPSLSPLEKAPDIADWFYVPTWSRQQATPLEADGTLPRASWLVLVDPYGFGADLVAALEHQGQDVWTVVMGPAFARLAERVYAIDPRQAEAFQKLFVELQSQGRLPENIVHLWSLTPDTAGTNAHPPARREALEAALEAGLYSLLSLAQALGTHVPAASARPDHYDVVVVTNFLHEVTGDEPAIDAVKATLLGPCKIIPQEYPHIRCRCLDIAYTSSPAADPACLIADVLAQCHAATSATVLAYRGRYWWEPRYEPRRLAAPGADPRLKEAGVYLLAGGLGGMGLTLATYLAQAKHARLVLTGRTPLPARDAWEHWLTTHAADDPSSVKIRQLLHLEALGGQVLVLHADVANRDQMQHVIEQAHAMFGPINGVIHCAGVVDYAGMIHRRTRAETAAVLAAKVQGTLVLEQLLGGAALDFFVVCSSLGTILVHTKFGQVGYCAANDFLDAFASEKCARDGTLYVSINWDDWQEVGMTVESDKVWAQTHGRLPESFKTAPRLSPAEGVEVFRRVVASALPRVAISVHDLSQRLLRDAQSAPDILAEMQSPPQDQPRHPRPQLQSAYAPPATALERRLTEMWQEVFGMQTIGIHDNFFALGGDSLLGITLVNRLQAWLGETVHVTALFDAPTIAELAAYCRTEYPAAVARLTGAVLQPDPTRREDALTLARIDQLRQVFLPPAPRRPPAPVKNRPAIFILCPPRSGSTLLRVMLSGHPRLFAPPELALLSFDTLQARQAFLSAHDPSMLEGVIRAVMQLKACNAEQARAIVAACEQANWTVPQFYGQLQAWLGDRTLVDKTPAYAFDTAVLQRAEDDFDQPLYIHLLRHPIGVMLSYERAKMDLLIPRAWRQQLPLAARELAELQWLLSHQNILTFFAAIPAHRQCQITFEELVRTPRATVEHLCEFLGLAFVPEMLEPYQDPRQRMTDGIHPASRMLGDVNFHQHTGIDAASAEHWREHYEGDGLQEMTWQVAESFGYVRPAAASAEHEEGII